MSKEDNKATVDRWFTDFWGKICNLGIVDELATPAIRSMTVATRGKVHRSALKP